MSAELCAVALEDECGGSREEIEEALLSIEEAIELELRQLGVLKHTTRHRQPESSSRLFLLCSSAMASLMSPCGLLLH